MRNLKKFLALVLAMMMTLSLMVTVNAASDFTDSEKINDKFSEAVQVLEGIGVFKGYEVGDKTEFRPTNNISRAEVAAIVYRLATGDAKENQAHLYEAGAAKFVDVADDHWAAGAIGYCANNLLVLGYDDTHFGPSDNVTGVQALAMILRAVGYGKNDEFKGYGWETNVYGVARSENLLKNVDSSSYASRLSLPATRELVAELLFQAAQIPTVTWTMLGGYNKYTDILGSNNKLNLSLGEKFFGLTSLTGIIVGNQATGEKYTLLGVKVDANRNAKPGYVYKTGDDTASGDITAGALPASLSFDFDTGLNDFGHKVKVWYDYRSADSSLTIGAGDTAVKVDDEFTNVYCVADMATRVDVVAADDGVMATKDDALNKAAKAAGFAVNTDDGAWVSDAFGKIADDQATTAPTTKGTSNVFLLISNSGAKGDKTNALDLVVSLEVGLAKVDAKNDYAANKNVTLLTGAALDTELEIARTEFDTNLLVYGEKAIKVGSWVVVNNYVGTNTEFDNSASDADLFGLDAITEKVEGKITGMTSTGTVTINGKEYPASALWDTDLTPASKRGEDELMIGNTVTLHLDKYGKYVRVTVGGADELLGAYAYWQQEGIDGIKYYIQGVTEEGKIITKEITQEDYNTNFAKVADNAIPIHHMRNVQGGTDSSDITLGGNLVIMNPVGVGYMPYSVNEDGEVDIADWNAFANVNFTEDMEALYEVDDISGDITKANFINDKTVFHVITGWGSTLKVDSYTGLKALMKGSNSVLADVCIFTKADDTEQAGSQNDVIETVLLVNTKWIQANSFVYTKDVPTDDIATKDGKAHQFQVYSVGQDTLSYILTADYDTDGNATPGTAYNGFAVNTFYTYTLTKEGYYQLVADHMDGENGDGFGIKQEVLERSTANGGTAFGYILTKTGIKLDAKNATVLDVTGDDHGITNYETLRRAAERNDITVDILLTSVGGKTASVIYVTDVAPMT